MFGDGNLAACKPISEADLAAFIADCVTETDKINKAGHRTAPRAAPALVLLCPSAAATSTAPCPAPPHALVPSPSAFLARPPRRAQLLPIGGPSKAYTAKQQADLLFGITGLPPKYFPVPVALMDGIISIFDALAKVFPALEVRCASSRARPATGRLPAASQPARLARASATRFAAPARQPGPRHTLCTGLGSAATPVCPA
jgi:divinyl chlorophyllide a 8-vinyl-reductase